MANFSIVDTHTHGYFPGWNDREAMFDRARKAGVVAQIQIGCDEKSTHKAIEMARENNDFFATVGVHPNDVKHIGNPHPEHRIPESTYVPICDTVEELFALYDQWIKENRNLIVGLGECGFDWYHDSREELYDAQLDVLLRHLELAKKYDLPLVIHTRDAKEDIIKFFREHILGTDVRGVIHCYSEDLETARFFTEECGFMLGIGGIVTYKKSDELREVVKEIDLKYLITETDAPFLTPFEFRKNCSVNESAALVEVVEKIAEVRGEDVNDVAVQLVENAKRVFGLSKD